MPSNALTGRPSRSLMLVVAAIAVALVVLEAERLTERAVARAPETGGAGDPALAEASS